MADNNGGEGHPPARCLTQQLYQAGPRIQYQYYNIIYIHIWYQARLQEFPQGETPTFSQLNFRKNRTKFLKKGTLILVIYLVQFCPHFILVMIDIFSTNIRHEKNNRSSGEMAIFAHFSRFFTICLYPLFISFVITKQFKGY